LKFASSFQKQDPHKKTGVRKVSDLTDIGKTGVRFCWKHRDSRTDP